MIQLLFKINIQQILNFENSYKDHCQVNFIKLFIFIFI